MTTVVDAPVGMERGRCNRQDAGKGVFHHLAFSAYQ